MLMHSEVFLVRVVVCERVSEALSERIFSLFPWQSTNELNNFVPDEKVAMLIVVKVCAKQILVLLK
jgi:hypothetical protein